MFLLNINGLAPADWARLRLYVADGGGLVVAPGDKANPDNYDGTAAASLLPARLDGKPTEKDTTFGKAEFNHPLFSRYPKLLDPELTSIPVYRHWPVKPFESARTLLRYADGTPALLERIFKGARTGRVLIWTTPLTRQVSRNIAGAWNEFPGSWAFLSLMLETVPYLSGLAGEKLNYEAGQDAVLNIDPAHRAPNYSVQGPDPKLTEQLAVPADSRLAGCRLAAKGWAIPRRGAGGRRVEAQDGVQPERAQRRSRRSSPSSPKTWPACSAGRTATRWPTTRRAWNGPRARGDTEPSCSRG